MGEELERVRFTSCYVGSIQELLQHMSSQEQSYFYDVTQQMSDIMWEVEESGAAPILQDGKVGGNCVAKILVGGREHIVVTKSGKHPGKRMDPAQDVCVVENFDEKAWMATYMAATKSVLPTSDTPLHYAVLKAAVTLGWHPLPTVVVHGHALQSAEQALLLNLPCSMEQTMCSTPADARAATDLLGQYAYPEHKVFIRRDHGFLLLAQDFTEAQETFRQVIKPYM